MQYLLQYTKEYQGAYWHAQKFPPSNLQTENSHLFMPLFPFQAAFKISIGQKYLWKQQQDFVSFGNLCMRRQLHVVLEGSLSYNTILDTVYDIVGTQIWHIIRDLWQSLLGEINIHCGKDLVWLKLLPSTFMLSTWWPTQPLSLWDAERRNCYNTNSTKWKENIVSPPQTSPNIQPHRISSI